MTPNLSKQKMYSHVNYHLYERLFGRMAGYPSIATFRTTGRTLEKYFREIVWSQQML